MKSKAKKIAKILQDQGLEVTWDDVMNWFMTIDEDEIVAQTAEDLAEWYTQDN